MNIESQNEAVSRSIWIRGLFMLLFAVIYSVVEILVVLVAVFQFFCVVITGQKNDRVLDLGRHLSLYIFEILRFEMFDTERLPFPFSPWPGPGGDEA
jgi:hypothetical protein